MKIDKDYGLVASDDELNIYRKIDKQRQYSRKQNKASKRRRHTDKRKDYSYTKKMDYFYSVRKMKV
ncbi:hypothetical protein WZ78_10175 [Leuconostoc mesenteroides subsp. dextranicum]|uniref:hypothetical protein n=1 Tax=Leuconostoc mesenteroides TaxID=1245 RepID=UPI000681DC95|nr:hypothetical protein [Leuconostoc mesenteroides]KMY79097.1 hypothetical protein WZ78_10175 [Leuconostoc mesenteroides subsp. dextranicum]